MSGQRQAEMKTPPTINAYESLGFVNKLWTCHAVYNWNSLQFGAYSHADVWFAERQTVCYGDGLTSLDSWKLTRIYTLNWLPNRRGCACEFRQRVACVHLILVNYIVCFMPWHKTIWNLIPNGISMNGNELAETQFRLFCLQSAFRSFTCTQKKTTYKSQIVHF